jgi:glucose/arabinose dehydrogenase
VRRIADLETAEGEGGLLGLAVSPAFADDGLVYAYYTTARDNRIVRFRLDDGPGGAVEPVLTGLAAARLHDGGRIAFGPDGMLYAGVGDAARSASAQDVGNRNGKILRMRPDGGVPADNPFPGSLVYSLGHRNVQGLAWDDAGNLWASEFGQNAFDEVNLIRPGANYGWPQVEGRGGPDASRRFTDPVVVWTTDEASPSGVAFLDGVLYVAGLRGQRLWAVPLDGTSAGPPQALLERRLGRLRTVAVAPDGSLWVTTSNTDGRGSPRDGDDRIISLR